MPIIRKNPPAPYILMDSMRSIGYTFNAAVADIIDNSISASAKNIWIEVPTDPSLIYLAFIDDGCGMTSKELFDAMKYGSKSKGDVRSETDLGRFGLGLNTASFSQCTKLTVVSKKNGIVSGERWDLEEVKRQGDWALLELGQEEITDVPCFEKLNELAEGTLVVWENFDILYQLWNGQVYKGLTENVNDAGSYLGLIFHRFISDTRNPLNIFINDGKVPAVDPFLESNKKTEQFKPIDLAVNDNGGVTRHIHVTPYLLPYLKDLSETDKQQLGGVARISSMQGFYVYRNKRLIIYATWFHMAYRNELAKYARIKVDIPSTLDDLWKIDVKKQSAELPPVIKKQLQRSVENLKSSSRKKNDHRLTVVEGDEDALWRKNVGRNKTVTYKINRESPFIKQLLAEMEAQDARKALMIIDSIEKSIPYHDMYTDEANGLISNEWTDEEKDSLLKNAISFRNMLSDMGIPHEVVVQRIMSVDPFRGHEWIREKLETES